MPKRKASFAFSYERPNKLSKHSSSTTVSESLNSLTRQISKPKKPLAVLKWPSVNKHQTNEITENSVSPPLTEAGSSSPPSLRRASTLTLEDLNHSQCVVDKELSNQTDPVPLPCSDTNKFVTSLLALKSGSTVGVTTISSTSSQTKASSSSTVSEQQCSVADSSTLPSFPKGLTKFALGTDFSTCGSLRISKSALITDIDETEIALALDSLKSSIQPELQSFKSSFVKSVENNDSCIKDDLIEENQSPEVSDMKELEDPIALCGSDVMQVVIAFDLSESCMISCVQEVCTYLQNMYKRLQSDIQGIQWAFIVYGGSVEVMRWIDFGSSLPELLEFLESVTKPSTKHSNICHVHDILKKVQQVFSWTPESRRHVIFINSIGPKSFKNVKLGKRQKSDWVQYCEALAEMGVKIYGVQIGWESEAAELNFEMAKMTNGLNLRLTKFESLCNTILMICLRESNPFDLQSYHKELFSRAVVPNTVETNSIWKQLCEDDNAKPFAEHSQQVGQNIHTKPAVRERSSKIKVPVKQYDTRSKGRQRDNVGKQKLKSKREDDKGKQKSKSRLRDDKGKKVSKSRLGDNKGKKVSKSRLGDDKQKKVSKSRLEDDKGKTISKSRLEGDEGKKVSKSRLEGDKRKQVSKSRLGDYKGKQKSKSRKEDVKGKQISKSRLGDDKGKKVSKSRLGDDKGKQKSKSRLGDDKEKQKSKSRQGDNKGRQKSKRDTAAKSKKKIVLKATKKKQRASKVRK